MFLRVHLRLVTTIAFIIVVVMNSTWIHFETRLVDRVPLELANQRTEDLARVWIIKRDPTNCALSSSSHRGTRG